jgi:hypothetical protein
VPCEHPARTHVKDSITTVLLFVAPWVLTYTDRVGASWTSWVVGAIAVVLGGSAVPASNRAHQQAIQH